MGMQTFDECLMSTTFDGPAVTVAAEALIVPDFVIPANYLYQGRTLRATTIGKISNVVTATPQMTWRARLGLTSLTGTLALASSTYSARATVATNETWMAEWIFTCRSSGTAGTVMVTGEITVPNAGGATAAAPSRQLLPQSAPATFAVDTTVQNILGFTFQWGTAAAGNTIQVVQHILEGLT